MKPIAGGVSRKCYPNEKVDYKGKNITSKASPRMVTDGCDLGKNATNSRGKFKNVMLSPNAQANSIAKG